MKLDLNDAKILEILQKNARTPIKDIASSSRITAPTVSARIKALEETGVLSGYHADILPSSLGQGAMELLVKTKPHDAEAVSAALAEMPSIREVHIASGGQVIAIAVFRNIMDLDNILDTVSEIPLILGYDQFMIADTKKKEPWAIVAESVQVSINCYYCRRPIEGTPYKIRLDGRDHFLCCPICEREYRKKYEDLKERARVCST